MCSLKAIALSAALLLTPALFAQKAKPDDSKVRSQPCVIVKGHVHKFGENMSRLHPHRPFDCVEGDYSSGFKWRSELSDGDVKELQQKGGKMVVLSPDYQLADLEDARRQCNNESSAGSGTLLRGNGNGDGAKNPPRILGCCWALCEEVDDCEREAMPRNVGADTPWTATPTRGETRILSL